MKAPSATESPLRLGEERQGKAESHAGDQQGLPATQRDQEAEERRHDQQPHAEECRTTSTSRPAVAMRMLPVSPVPATSADIVASMRMATRSSAMRMPNTASRARFSKRRSLERVRHDHGG
jgi:hypothetical protein